MKETIEFFASRITMADTSSIGWGDTGGDAQEGEMIAFCFGQGDIFAGCVGLAAKDSATQGTNFRRVQWADGDGKTEVQLTAARCRRWCDVLRPGEWCRFDNYLSLGVAAVQLAFAKKLHPSTLAPRGSLENGGNSDAGHGGRHGGRGHGGGNAAAATAGRGKAGAAGGGGGLARGGKAAAAGARGAAAGAGERAATASATTTTTTTAAAATTTTTATRQFVMPAFECRSFQRAYLSIRPAHLNHADHYAAQPPPPAPPAKLRAAQRARREKQLLVEADAEAAAHNARRWGLRRRGNGDGDGGGGGGSPGGGAAASGGGGGGGGGVPEARGAVGWRVACFWEGEGEWFEGYVRSYAAFNDSYFVRYDDGDSSDIFRASELGAEGYADVFSAARDLLVTVQ